MDCGNSVLNLEGCFDVDHQDFLGTLKPIFGDGQIIISGTEAREIGGRETVAKASHGQRFPLPH